MALERNTYFPPPFRFHISVFHLHGLANFHHRRSSDSHCFLTKIQKDVTMHSTLMGSFSGTSAGGLSENSLSRLRKELLSVRYDDKAKLDSDGFLDGNPRVYVSLLQFCIFGFSRPIGRMYSEGGYAVHENLTASGFLESAFRFLQEKIGTKVPFSVVQYLTPGNADKKAVFLVDVIRALKHKHNEMYREKLEAAPASTSPHTASSSTMTSGSGTSSSHSIPQSSQAAVSKSSAGLNATSSAGAATGTASGGSSSRKNSASPPLSSSAEGPDMTRLRMSALEGLDMNTTIRSSMSFSSSKLQKDDTNRDALNRFETIAIPVDDNDRSKGTRVVEFNMQELFNLLNDRMDTVELRFANLLSRALEPVSAKLSMLETRVRLLEDASFVQKQPTSSSPSTHLHQRPSSAPRSASHFPTSANTAGLPNGTATASIGNTGRKSPLQESLNSSFSGTPPTSRYDSRP
eukprot:ANDGO_00175.mRNA.1 hypothetical protein EMIHUDRAFT_217370